MVELLVVVLVLGILVAIIAPAISEMATESKETSESVHLKNIEGAVENFFVKNGYYPTDDKNDTIDVSDEEAGEMIRTEWLVPEFLHSEPDGSYFIMKNGQVALDINLYKYKKVTGGYELIGYDFDRLEAAGYPTRIKIPREFKGEPVVSIGREAFHADKEKHKITYVEIPNTVTKVGYRAFRYNNISYVKIPESVTHIEEGAFAWNAMESVRLPNSLKVIGQSAFYKNELNRVEIPNSVTTIMKSAFNGNRLTSLQLGSSVEVIGEGAFSWNRLQAVEFPSSVKNIQTSAFYENRLVEVRIPKSVETIGASAFTRNVTLEKVYLTQQMKDKLGGVSAFQSGAKLIVEQ